MGNPLAGEGLQLFDRVARGVGEERPDEVKALVVGDVRRGFLASRLAIEILGDYEMSMTAPGRRSCGSRLTWDTRVETTVGVTARLTVAVFMMQKPTWAEEQQPRLSVTVQRLPELRR